MDQIIVDGHFRKILPTQQHTATVIFNHGLGQSNFTWANLVLEALAPHLPHVLWILPQSTQRPVSVSQMQFRPSWFNIWRLPPHQDEYDETAIFESVSVIENIIIEQVSRGIDSRRIVVCGFSQGAALSLIVGLTTLYELGGIISLSGWIPERVRDQMIHTRLQLPVLWCHGTCDIEIPESYGLNAMSFLLRNLQIPEQYLTYRRYDGLAHTINDQELDDVVLWLQKVVGSD